MSNSYDPMDCSSPGSSIHGISWARVLEWVAISFSRGSSQPRNQTWVSCLAGRVFTNWAATSLYNCAQNSGNPWTMQPKFTQLIIREYAWNWSFHQRERVFHLGPKKLIVCLNKQILKKINIKQAKNNVSHKQITELGTTTHNMQNV